ncbi:MAG: SHOCT domain-containing protein [Clostridia bacterium]|nr:SHOCT domain-containing protein [Clostridia bacterium]
MCCSDRTNKSSNVATVSSADELKKFKDLLDSGVITQEEFDTKKKQLLGL